MRTQPNGANGARKMKLMWLLLFVPVIVRADYSAKLYEQGGANGKHMQIFSFISRNSTVNGKTVIINEYFDMKGSLVVKEQATLEGHKIVRDEVDQKQIDQTGIMQVKNGVIYFTKIVNGQSSTRQENLTDTFVTACNFEYFIRDHWSELLAGKKVEFRYGVWDRQESVGFKNFNSAKDETVQLAHFGVRQTNCF